jgi:hypothetical protein
MADGLDGIAAKLRDFGHLRGLARSKMGSPSSPARRMDLLNGVRKQHEREWIAGIMDAGRALDPAGARFRPPHLV